MENAFIYLAKVTGLIALFYLAYILLLRRETFFSGNRWFLLLGLITSAILPLFFITKIIWVEPIAPTNSLDWSTIPVTTSVTAPESEINWYLIGACIYCIGIAILLLKLILDFNNLSKIVKGKTIQQLANFKLIDIKENIAPFSYFNYIVYNSALYTAVELENILEHEKIHSSQKHSIDVLISRLFCVFFWFNPLIWLYKKAIAQNLEFIADSEAAKKITDKKAYQLTLLKITTQENCVAITNHFYQSLIKKRIIMLNKSQSKKWNSWKYITVFPALVAFVFLFQIEVVAQEKEAKVNKTAQQLEILKTFYITKTTTDETIKSEIHKFKKEYKTDIVFSKIKRNTKGEIITIKVDINCPNQETTQYLSLHYKPIKPIIVFVAKKKNTNQIVGFSVSSEYMNKNTRLYDSSGIYEMPTPPPPKAPKPLKLSDKDIYIDGVKSSNEELEKLDKSTIDKMDVNTLENTIKVTTKTIAKLDDKNVIRVISNPDETKPLIVLNGQINSSIKIEEIDPDKIHSINVLKGFQATSKYGESGKNGILEITTKEKTTLKNFKPIQRKTSQGFQILKQLESEKINENPNKKIIKSYLKEYYIDGKKTTAYEYSKLNINSIEKVETDPFKKEVAIITKKTTSRNSNQISEKETKTNLKSAGKGIDSIESRKIFNNALVIIDGKKTDYESLLKIKDKNIKFTHAVIFERSTDESKKIALATYGEKARNGVLVVETSPIEKK